MNHLMLILALLFTFGAGAAAGWHFSTLLMARAVSDGRMREFIERYEERYGKPK